MQRLFFVVFLFCILANSVEAAKVLHIDANSSLPMKSHCSIKRIAVGSPDIATVLQVPDSLLEFLIVAHNAGSTTLFVWTEDGKRHDYVVNVSTEDIGIAKDIESAIGLPDVHVKKVQNRILLTGTVENQYERNYALQVASLFVGETSSGNSGVGSVSETANSSGSSRGTASSSNLGEKSSNGNIIDLLQMRNPTQVRLEAQVIAIRPTDRQNLGIQYGNNPNEAPGIFVFGEDHGTGTPFRNNPLNWATDRHAPINLQVQALIVKNKAKILSRPSIMTMSGEPASIRVGGEIPYVIRGSDGIYTTNFKNYGIILQFKPIVDAENRIVSAIHAEVSNMSGETVDGQPILNHRGADSVVTMTSGSTLVIGGLLDSSEQKNVVKVPLLGDIPIIGEFFKYTSKTKEKQELIILVTPYIVESDSVSRVKMSEEMEEHYLNGQRERALMREVDLNEEWIE